LHAWNDKEEQIRQVRQREEGAEFSCRIWSTDMTHTWGSDLVTARGSHRGEGNDLCVGMGASVIFWEIVNTKKCRSINITK
jgi:hypothetical protein